MPTKVVHYAESGKGHASQRIPATTAILKIVVTDQGRGVFSGKVHCPKCLLGHFLTHSPTVKLQSHAVGMTCRVCGYSWICEVMYVDGEEKIVSI